MNQQESFNTRDRYSKYCVYLINAKLFHIIKFLVIDVFPIYLYEINAFDNNVSLIELVLHHCIELLR